MSRLLRIRARPRLTAPIMLAAWPGVGNVAMIVAEYLRTKLVFKELGEIDAPYFFDPIGVLAQDNVVQAPQFPRSRFYYRKGSTGERDLILFVGDDQPTAKVYELAQCVLEAGARFQVDRVVTCAAALTRIHLTEQPKVWAVATTEALTEDLQRHDLLHHGNVQIAGLNGLLLGAARENLVDGICLLGEVPTHASRVENPMAALAILRVLSGMLGIKLDFTDLSETARETTAQLKQAMALAMEEYIEHFTQPIWEQGREYEEDDEED